MAKPSKKEQSIRISSRVKALILDAYIHKSTPDCDKDQTIEEIREELLTLEDNPKLADRVIDDTLNSLRQDMYSHAQQRLMQDFSVSTQKLEDSYIQWYRFFEKRLPIQFTLIESYPYKKSKIELATSYWFYTPKDGLIITCNDTSKLADESLVYRMKIIIESQNNIKPKILNSIIQYETQINERWFSNLPANQAFFDNIHSLVSYSPTIPIGPKIHADDIKKRTQLFYHHIVRLPYLIGKYYNERLGAINHTK